MGMRAKLHVYAALLALMTLSVPAQLGKILDKINVGKLIDDKIIAGLREALQVGT